MPHFETWGIPESQTHAKIWERFSAFRGPDLLFFSAPHVVVTASQEVKKRLDELGWPMCIGYSEHGLFARKPTGDYHETVAELNRLFAQFEPPPPSPRFAFA
jgi:hypothetical protein